MKWTREDIPDLEGKTAVVTGANSGIGYETARALAENDAEVVMGCRNPRKAEEAKEEIEAEFKNAKIRCITLDLANKSQIKVFAAKFREEFEKLDLMINNAGVMHTDYKRTDFGFEYQFGVNFLGHFLLNSELIDLIEEAEDSRVISVSSILHEDGELDFEKLNSESDYDKERAYANSKIALLLYAKELQRRFESENMDSKSIAVHPGFVNTQLHSRAASNIEGNLKGLMHKGITKTLAQSAEKGVLPTLYAATSERIEGGEFIGPDGFKELRGNPVEVEPDEKAEKRDLARKLWDYSDEMMETEFKV